MEYVHAGSLSRCELLASRLASTRTQLTTESACRAACCGTLVRSKSSWFARTSVNWSAESHTYTRSEWHTETSSARTSSSATTAASRSRTLGLRRERRVVTTRVMVRRTTRSLAAMFTSNNRTWRLRGRVAWSSATTLVCLDDEERYCYLVTLLASDLCATVSVRRTGWHRSWSAPRKESTRGAKQTSGGSAA